MFDFRKTRVQIPVHIKNQLTSRVNIKKNMIGPMKTRNSPKTTSLAQNTSEKEETHQNLTLFIQAHCCTCLCLQAHHQWICLIFPSILMGYLSHHCLFFGLPSSGKNKKIISETPSPPLSISAQKYDRASPGKFNIHSPHPLCPMF